MPKQIGDPRQVLRHSPSLDERIAGLRRRRRAVTHLIDSLTTYAHFAGHESDLTDLRRLHNRSGQLPGQVRRGNLGSTRRPGSCQEKEAPTDAVEP
jgi:hypothetical protein